MNNLQQLEEILKKCIGNGWEPFNLQDIDNIRLNLKCIVVYFRSNDDISFTGYSHNDLFSVESGLLQFVKWKVDSLADYIAINPTIHGMRYEDYVIEQDQGYWQSDRQYHAMMMSILPVHDKIQYFLENIDIDKPQ